MALITAQNVSLGYEGNTVISDLNFEINKGDYLTIIGENGSGKSTLIKGLLRLKQPQSGKFTWGDGLRPCEIGYLPQQTAAQKDFPASVYEVVLSGCLNTRGLKPFYSKKDKETALFNIENLGLTHLKKACYRDLSGGQQQRVLLARALCATGKMLLLDEPVSGLDPVVTGELYNFIKELNSVTGITVVMVSHDMHSAFDNANKILHLQNKQLFFGKTEDYLQTETGTRYTGGLR